MVRRRQGGQQRGLVVAAFTQRGTALQHRKESRSQATLRPSWSSVEVVRLRLSSRGLVDVDRWFGCGSRFSPALSFALSHALFRGAMGDQARYPRWQM